MRYLERAVEIKPEDPTLNDHLGDAFWQVGREREARFQWGQALILEPGAGGRWKRSRPRSSAVCRGKAEVKAGTEEPAGAAHRTSRRRSENRATPQQRVVE